MANDRMWLVHKPSGKRALIAKTLGDGWYEYEGSAHAPYYSVRGLFDETGDDSTDYELRFESTEAPDEPS